MGYYTYHTLKVRNVLPNEEEALVEAMKELDIIPYALSDVPYHYDANCVACSGDDAVKWYEHEEDMLELSKMFPLMIFKLHGEGEESGDLWNCYYRNGESEECRAEIMLPEPKTIPWD